MYYLYYVKIFILMQVSVAPTTCFSIKIVLSNQGTLLYSFFQHGQKLYLISLIKMKVLELQLLSEGARTQKKLLLRQH